jgi:hypothetical protein
LEALNRHPIMRELYTIHLNLARAKGLWMHTPYTLADGWGKWGQWGHLETEDQPVELAPKYRAMLDWIETTRKVRRADQAKGHVPSFRTEAQLAFAQYGKPYEQELETEGGDGARRLEIIATALVDGLTIGLSHDDPAVAFVRGKPRAAGVSYVFARVVDADGDAAYRIFNTTTTGGPGVIFESNLRGKDPGMHTPWTQDSIQSSQLARIGGLRFGPAAHGEKGDDALTFSVMAQAQPSTLGQAASAGAYVSLAFEPKAGMCLDLRRAEVRFTVARLSYHAPKKFALMTSVEGFEARRAIFDSRVIDSENEPVELVVTLPDSAAYAKVKGAVELRIVPYEASYAGHRVALSSLKVTMPSFAPVACGR